MFFVKKSNGDWKVCMDFANLNKACFKNGFPDSRIHQMIDATSGHELLNFMMQKWK